MKCIKPHTNTLKLNNDSCGEGGTIRNSTRKIIFAYFIPLGPGMSNYAEATTMMYELKWCLTHDSRTVWGETDNHSCYREANKLPIS